MTSIYNKDLKNNDELKKQLIMLVRGDSLSVAGAARALGISERTAQSFYNAETRWAWNWWQENGDIVDKYFDGFSDLSEPEHPIGIYPPYKSEEDDKKLSSNTMKGAKVLFLDLEVSASIVAAFSMFKHFSTPDHIIEFPYILTYACNWLHEDEMQIHCKGLDDYPTFSEDVKDDFELVSDVWRYLDAADLVVIQNASFDTGWLNQRFAYHGLPEPSPYRIVCTLKGLKKAMALPSNSLGYSTKYFNLGYNKLHHEGISLWIKCMQGDPEAFELMKTYNRGDIPTLRQLYLKIRPYIPNHPNISLYYGDDEMRCGVCGGKHLTKLEQPAYTNLSSYESYRCGDCGTVRRTNTTEVTAEQRKKFTRTIVK